MYDKIVFAMSDNTLHGHYKNLIKLFMLMLDCTVSC